MRVPGVRYVQGRNSYGDRDGRKFGVAIHNTANDASAAGEASYATRRTDGVSAHFYVDDREVIQSIDTKYRTGHAGSSTGNENAISVEITGTNGKSRAWWLENVAWDRLAEVLAVVCREYDIEPRRASVTEMKKNPKVRAFYGHDDMRLAWGGTTHTDPGPNFPWDHLLATVRRALDGDTEDDMPLSSKDISAVAERVWSATWGPETAGGRLLEARDEARRARLTAEATLTAVQGAGADRVLARIEQIAQEERERDAAAARERAALPGQILAALPGGDGPVSRDDLEAALRSVLGSVDEPPADPGS